MATSAPRKYPSADSIDEQGAARNREIVRAQFVPIMIGTVGSATSQRYSQLKVQASESEPLSGIALDGVLSSSLYEQKFSWAARGVAFFPETQAVLQKTPFWTQIC